MNQLTLTDQQIVDAIDRIAGESGRNEKERLLSDLVSTEQGRRLVNWCYNTFLTFGITQKAMPDIPSKSSNPSQFSDIEGLLAQLSSRQLTGNAAREAVDAMFAALNPAAQKLLWLCLNKDLKAGVAEASIRAVDPSLIPTFAVMRAHTYEERLIKTFPVAVEPKLDGHRTTFISRGGSGGFYTRTGKVVPALDHLVKPMLDTLRQMANMVRIANAGDPLDAMLSAAVHVRGIPELVLDGEAMTDGGFNDTSGALRRESVAATEAHFNIFDCLTWAEFDAMGSVEVPWIERRRRVLGVVAAAALAGQQDRIRRTLVCTAHSHEEIAEIYANYRAEGHEGAMVKAMDGFYDKKKSRGWLKMKASDTEDLPVVGAFPGEPGTKYEHCLGGLIVEREHEGKMVQVRVGGGFTDAERISLWQSWIADSSPLHTPEYACQLLGKIIEIEFHEVTKDGSLRHPRFIRFRPDKDGEIDK